MGAVFHLDFVVLRKVRFGMSERLKPCPFCGGRAEIISRNPLPNTVYAISCRMPGCMAFTGWSRSLVEAISAWNRRTPDIVRCGECKHKYKGHCAHGPMATEKVDDNFGCTEGQRREKEEPNG